MDVFIYLFYLFFTLQYCIGFAIHQHESATGIHKFPLLNPLQPPSPYHPSGLSQCTSILYPASNLDWWFVSYMIYSFNAILPNHPALSLSHRVKKSVLYICVSFAISALLTMPQPLTVWITINCGKFWKRWEYQTTWLASWETCMQVRKQQLELDMEQQTGSK